MDADDARPERNPALSQEPPRGRRIVVQCTRTAARRSAGGSRRLGFGNDPPDEWLTTAARRRRSRPWGKGVILLRNIPYSMPPPPARARSLIRINTNEGATVHFCRAAPPSVAHNAASQRKWLGCRKNPDASRRRDASIMDNYASPQSSRLQTGATPANPSRQPVPCSKTP